MQFCHPPPFPSPFLGLGDFLLFSTVISINTSVATRCVGITITNDTVVEEDEFFMITLTSTDSVDFVGGPARVIITDDDGET